MDEQRSRTLQAQLVGGVVLVRVPVVSTAAGAEALPLAVNLQTHTPAPLQPPPLSQFGSWFVESTRLVWLKGLGIWEKVNLHPEYTCKEKSQPLIHTARA